MTKRKYFTAKDYRAMQRISDYKKYDKKKGYETDIPHDFMLWIMEQPCTYCGIQGWDVIGCNRLDNSKGHTMDNVEPCCWRCNTILGTEEIKKPVVQLTLDGQFVKRFESAAEAEEDGFRRVHIGRCCNGGIYSHQRGKWVNVNQHKGFKWMYEDEYKKSLEE